MATAQAARRLARVRLPERDQYDWWFAPRGLGSEILSDHRFPSHLRDPVAQPGPPPPFGLLILDDGGDGFVSPRLLPVLEVTEEELVALYLHNNPGGVRPDYTYVSTRFIHGHQLRGFNRFLKLALLALVVGAVVILATRWWRRDDEDDDDDDDGGGGGGPPPGPGGLPPVGPPPPRPGGGGGPAPGPGGLPPVAPPPPPGVPPPGPPGAHGGGGLLDALRGHARIVTRDWAVSDTSPQRMPSGGNGGRGLLEALTGDAATRGSTVWRPVVAEPSSILSNSLSSAQAEPSSMRVNASMREVEEV